MEKIGLIIKQEAERILKDKLKKSDSLLLVKYTGVSASELDFLRSSLSNIGSSLMVIKNSVSKRVFKSHKNLNTLIEGPCGIIFVNNDLITTSRIIYKFIKEKPNLEVRAGFLKDRIITNQELEALSKFPSISALQAQIVRGLKSPIFYLLFGLKQILNKLALALVQIMEKKALKS